MDYFGPIKIQHPIVLQSGAFCWHGGKDHFDIRDTVSIISFQPWIERAILDHLRMIWGHLGLGEEGVRGKPRRGILQWEGGRKDRTFASCPMGAAIVSCKDFEGSPVWSLESCISQAYPVSPSPLQISPPYPVPTLRGKNGVSCGGAQMPAVSLSEEGRVRRCTLAWGFLCSQHLSVQLSRLFSIWENSYSLQILVCPIK